MYILNTYWWEQASLPVRLVGFGIRSAVVLAPSAFLSSASGLLALEGQILPARVGRVPDGLGSAAVGQWDGLGPAGVTVPQPPGDSEGRQSRWDSPLCAALTDGLFAACVDPAGKVRLLTSRAKWSGDWLQAIPLARVGLRLDNASISIAVALQLGSAAVHAHTCVCCAPVLADGYDCLSCIKSAGRHAAMLQ